MNDNKSTNNSEVVFTISNTTSEMPKIRNYHSIHD